MCVVAAGSVCCALFSSLLTHALHALSPAPSPSLSVQDRKRPKDYAKTDTIKALLKGERRNGEGGWGGRFFTHTPS